MSDLTNPDLSIIIVNWNAGDLLLQCLASIAAGAIGITTEIWVVDNASTDNSVHLVQSNFPDVSLIANSENLGFATANNQAAIQARGRYLLFLNPDTEILPEALQKLVTYADAYPEIGVLGPRLLNPDGSHQRSCWRGYPDLTMALVDALYLWKIPWLPIAYKSEYRADELNMSCDVDHLLGACLLIRREAWKKVGPLDEGYFLFLEETDWCWRAKQAGWRIVFYPYVEVIHYGQHSSRQQPTKTSPLFYQSYCHFYRKYHFERGIRLLILKGIIALASIIRIGLWTMRAWRTNERGVREQSRRMVAGYQQVLHRLPSL